MPNSNISIQQKSKLQSLMFQSDVKSVRFMEKQERKTREMDI